jgi:hypothetical protein
MSNLITKWTPFDFACRLRSLQYGSLNVGNTQQNKKNLYNLAVAQANSPSSPPWAQWSTAHNATKTHSYLKLNVPLVPGYAAPPGVYQPAASSGLPLSVSMTAGAVSGQAIDFNGGYDLSIGNWHGYVASSAASPSFGSVSGSPAISGNAIVAIIETLSADVFVAIQGTLAQTAFTEIAYTDTAGAQSFLTASATQFIQEGGYTFWLWSSGAIGTFTNTSNYTINFS